MNAIEPSRSHEQGHETNDLIASASRKAASLLKAQDASLFRSLAYLKTANTVENLSEDVFEIAIGGLDALDAMQNIGRDIGVARPHIHHAASAAKDIPAT